MNSLVQLDHLITDKIRLWGRPWFGFWKFVAAQSIAIFVIGAGVYAYLGYLVFWNFLASFGLAYLVANVLQMIIRRNRPNFEKLTGYKMWLQTYSYPSAHATMSACAAASLCLLTVWPNSLVAGFTIAGAILLAILIGISRLIVGVHYLADVMFGWLVGFVVALAYVVLLVL